MAYLRELITLLGFEVDVAGFTKGEKAFAELVGLAKGAANAIKELTLGTADFAEDLNDVATRFGITNQQMQQMMVMADATGTSLQSLQQGFAQTLRRAQEAVSGNKEFTKSFAGIGFSVEDLKGMLADPMQLFGAVASRVDSAATAGERMQHAFRLMGRAGVQLAPDLGDIVPMMGAIANRSEEFNFLTDEQIELAKALKTENALLNASYEGLKRQLGLELSPVMRQIILDTREWLIRNKELIKDGIRILGETAKTAGEAITKLTLYIEANKNILVITAGVIGTLLIPSLIKIGIAVAPALAVVAAIVLLIGVIQELYYWANGMPSLLGDLFERAHALQQNPDKPWWVELALMLERALVAMRNLARESKDFLTGEDKTSSPNWKKMEEAANKRGGGAALATIRSDFPEGKEFEKPGSPGAHLMHRLGVRLNDVEMPSLSQLLFGQFGTPRSKESSAANITVNSPTTITINAAPGQSAEDVGRAAADQLRSRDSELQSTMNELQSNEAR